MFNIKIKIRDSALCVLEDSRFSRYMAAQDAAELERSMEEKYEELLWDESLISLCERLELMPGSFSVEDIARRRHIIDLLEELASHSSVELQQAEKSIENMSIGAIYDSLALYSGLRRVAEVAIREAAPILLKQEKNDEI